MEKDRATEYWDNEVKRAEEETAKALAEYNQAKKERLEARDRLNAEDNNADDEEQAKDKAQIFCKHRYKSAQAEIGHIEELTEIIE